MIRRPGFEPHWAYFNFQKISLLKGHWNEPAIQSTEWSLNGVWNATEIYLSRHHSVAIKPPLSPFSRLKGVVLPISDVSINLFEYSSLYLILKIACSFATEPPQRHKHSVTQVHFLSSERFPFIFHSLVSVINIP